MDFTLYWFMFPVSIGVATLAMLSGIGGAALFTPIFILVFPLLGLEYVLHSTIAAISAALITQTFGFLSGFIGYYRRRLIDFALAGRILRVAVPVGVLLAHGQHLADGLAGTVHGVGRQQLGHVGEHLKLRFGFLVGCKRQILHVPAV